MKNILVATGLGLSLAACSTTGWSEAPYDDRGYATRAPVSWWGRDIVSVNVFFEPLARYGNWGLHPHYGRVFYPYVNAGWQPYRVGYWRQDPRFGRTWVSSEPWGWATYHYGRWGRDDRLGWFWVPDTRFGPGWVDWRSSGSYVSWSPLPPPGWSRWGYGWGNDWWSHAPSYWAWRPGMHQHVRPGRPIYPSQPHRPDRPGGGQQVDRERPTPLPPGVHPRSTRPVHAGSARPQGAEQQADIVTQRPQRPAETRPGREVRPGDGPPRQGWRGREGQPPQGWQPGGRSGRPGADAARPADAPRASPRAAQPAAAVATPRPVTPAQPQAREAPRQQAPAREASRPQGQAREQSRGPSRDSMRGRDVAAHTSEN